MVADRAQARSGLQDGAWIEMADGREWLFTTPPAPGVDAEYDALVQGLLDAEDRSEAKKFELAIAILLLSRTYQPSPLEYQEIFCFGNEAAERSAQEAISTLICVNLQPDRRRAPVERSASATLRPQRRPLPALISSCAMHFRSTMAPWLH